MREAKRIVLAAFATIVLAACNDDALSRSEIVAKGDAACADAAEALDPLFSQLFPTGTETPSAKKAAPIMSEADEVVRAEVDAFDVIEASEDDEAFEEIRRGIRRVADGLHRSAEEASAGDTDGYLKELERVNQIDADVRADMSAYGFKTCADET